MASPNVFIGIANISPSIFTQFKKYEIIRFNQPMANGACWNSSKSDAIRGRTA